MAIERLMVAAPLVATEVGQEYGALPPHITVFPWFEINNSSWYHFNMAMKEVVKDTVQPIIQGGDAALFGPDETVPVRRLNRATPTFNIIHGFDIHAGVYRAVKRASGQYDPAYVGLKWTPHVSDTTHFALQEDEEITIPELVVLERRARTGIKAIRAVYKWEMVGARTHE